MIATRRTTVRDGDAGDVCLVTASAKVFEEMIVLVPIAGFCIGWDLVPHTTLPPCQTFR
jgi:hypothetical protein